MTHHKDFGENKQMGTKAFSCVNIFMCFPNIYEKMIYT